MEKGSVSRIFMLISMLIILGVGGFAGYLYITESNKEKESVVMFLDCLGGDIENVPKAYLKNENGIFRTIVEDGKEFGQLPKPTKYGNVFIGWFCDSISNVAIKSTDIVDFDSDFTIYAKWKAEAIYDYDINYLDMSGNAIKPSETKFAMNKSIVTVDVPTISGYTFNNESSTTTQTIGVSSIFNLYYKPNVYKISYRIPFLQVEYAEKTTFNYGEEISLIPISEIQEADSRFTIAQKEFSHWLVNGIQVKDGYEITKNNLEELGFSLNLEANPTNTITIDAVYVNAKYELSFVCQGLTYHEDRVDSNISLSQPANPNITGYIFQGWYTSDTGATGTNISGKTLFNFVRDVMPAQKLTLYAGFTLQEYNLVIDIGEGYYQSGQSNRAIYTIEDDFILTPPMCDGKEFCGWTGMGITVPTIDLRIFNMTGNRTYVANYI